MTKLALTVAILATTCLAFSSAGLADGDVGTMTPEKLEGSFPQKPPYSPYAGRDFPLRPLFGDTHLHTSYSMDAGAFGARLGPVEAYRFARGELVVDTRRTVSADVRLKA